MAAKNDDERNEENDNENSIDMSNTIMCIY